MRRTTRAAMALLLAGALLGTTGCVIRREPIERTDETSTREESVALEGAERVKLEMDMAAGRLVLAGDDLGPDALRGEFVYAPAELEPDVRSDLSGDTLDIAVQHREVQMFDYELMNGRDMKSDWDLTLAQRMPVDVDLRLGAGEATLDLADVDVRDLRLDAGAGRLEVDLSGERTEDVTGRIQTGVGALVVTLPRDVGVRVRGHGDGVGEWDYDGFRVDGDYLVNDAYDGSDTTIELDIQQGVGAVTLELVD